MPKFIKLLSIVLIGGCSYNRPTYWAKSPDGIYNINYLSVDPDTRDTVSIYDSKHSKYLYYSYKDVTILEISGDTTKEFTLDEVIYNGSKLNK